MERHKSSTIHTRRRNIESKTKLSFKEKLVLQFIVCGFLAAIIMVVSLIKIELFEQGLAEIKTIIQINPSIDDFTAGISDGLDKLGEMSKGVKTIFGFEAPESNGFLSEPPAETLIEDTETVEVSVEETDEPTTSDDFRIDEDILHDILTKEDLYNKYPESE